MNKTKKFNIFKSILSTTICLFLLINTSLLVNLSQLKDKAYAYQIPKVKSWKTQINADISTTGSISVSEQKIIDISKFIEKAKKYTPSPNPNDNKVDENFKNVKLSPMVWNFNSLPEKSDVAVSNAKIALINNEDKVIGNWQILESNKFDKKWHGNEGPNTSLYTYDEELKQICIFSSFTNEDQYSEKQCSTLASTLIGADINTIATSKAIISLNYTINQAPIVYKDVADFQWIYLTDTWVSDSYNVDLKVNIPVGTDSISNPLGKVTNLEQSPESTTERNIYAWGHGSSTGIVNFDSSGIVTLSNQIVPGGTDASVRIVFPSAWLTNLDAKTDITQSNQTKLSSILREESVWHDWRTDNVNKLFALIIFTFICTLLIVALLILIIIMKKKLITESSVLYNPEKIHPSFLYRIKHWNRPNTKDILCSILNMYNQNLIDIYKENSNDYIIKLKDKEMSKNPYSFKNINFIDIATINFLFSKCASKCSFIRLNDIFNYAKARSYSFLTEYLTWHSLLTDQVNAKLKFKSKYDKIRHKLYLVAIFVLIITAIVSFLISNPFILIPGIITALVISYCANTLRNHIYIQNKNKQKINVNKISLNIFENKNLEEFNQKFTKVLHESVLNAQDIISKYNINNFDN